MLRNNCNRQRSKVLRVALHRAFAAPDAISLRRSAVRRAARAFPPFFPPFRPSATAAGFFRLRLGFAGVSAVAWETTAAAN